MARFHINDAGEARKCRALVSCPFGSLKNDHFPTLELAAREAESRLAAEHHNAMASAEVGLSSYEAMLKAYGGEQDPETQFFKNPWKTMQKELIELSEKAFRPGVELRSPDHLGVRQLGFMVHDLPDGRQLALRTFHYEYEKLNPRDGYKRFVETFLFEDEKPVAMTSFIVSDKAISEFPPLIYQTEVRKGYRGKRLASVLKGHINGLLKRELHSMGEYSRAGYEAIDRSPVWKPALEAIARYEQRPIDEPVIWEVEDGDYVRGWKDLATQVWVF